VSLPTKLGILARLCKQGGVGQIISIKFVYNFAGISTILKRGLRGEDIYATVAGVLQ
jgi:hypothetical protein